MPPSLAATLPDCAKTGRPDACSHHGQQRDQARRTHAARRARGAPAAGPAGWTQQTQQGPISRHGAGSGRKVCVAAARTRLFSPGAGRFVESIIHEHPRRRPCRRRMGRPGAPPRVRGLARLVARAAARTRHVAPGQRRCELSPLPARRQRRRREPHRHGRAAAAGGRASVRADRAADRAGRPERAARARAGRCARLPAAHRPRHRALPCHAAAGACRGRDRARRRTHARGLRRAREMAAACRCPRAAGLRRGVAAARAGALPRMVRRARIRHRLDRRATGAVARGLRPPRRECAGPAARRRAPRLHAAQPDGPAPNPGILDFQDAVLGPITYDAASMLRDAFISWEEAQNSTGRCATGSRRAPPGCRWMPTSASSGASSSGWACSAT